MKSRLMIARRHRKWSLIGMEILFGHKNVLELHNDNDLHNFVNILKTNKLYAFKSINFVVNYLSVEIISSNY